MYTKFWQDFVLNAYNYVRKDGILTIPFMGTNTIGKRSSDYEKLLRQRVLQEDKINNKNHLQFVKKEDIPYRNSTFQFSKSRGLWLLFLLYPKEGDIYSTIIKGIPYLGSIEYRIAYKLPAVKLIAKKYLANKTKLSHMDIGGGYGVLAAGLSLEYAQIKDSTTLDNNTRYALVFDNLKSYYKFDGKRFKFVLADMNNYNFPADRYDSITALGSLLFIERKNRETVFERIWGSLKPGGIIVVQENIIDPGASKDIIDKLFTAQELDTLLSKYSPVRYYSSSSLEEITKETAANRNDVMRVIQKAEKIV